MTIYDELKGRVLASLGKEPQPIKAIAQKCSLSASTASKYCHILAAENKAEIKKYGNMKLVKRK
jgi:DNA-binding IclR family transcriptional regulator